jgi:cell division protein FtsL
MITQRHFFVGFGFLLCLLPLYWAKTQADKMRDHMQNLAEEVAEERQQVQILEAELAYLSRFDRLEKVASEKLGMAPINGRQISRIEDLDTVAPIRADAAPKVGEMYAK